MSARTRKPENLIISMQNTNWTGRYSLWLLVRSQLIGQVFTEDKVRMTKSSKAGFHEDNDPAISFLEELAGHASVAPLQETLENVVGFTMSLVKCDSCFAYVLEGDELVLRASNKPHPGIVDRLKLRLGEGITGWVAEHRKPVAVAANAWADPRFKLFNNLPEDRFESLLSVPVMTRGRVVGVINLQNQNPHHYTAREIQLVSTIGFLAGAEIEMARLEGESVQDITARKKAEDRFYKAFNANPEPISIVTMSEERILDVNESFLRDTGYQREEVIGRTSLDLNFWGRAEDRVSFFEKLRSRRSVRDLEMTFRTKSGDSRAGLVSAEVIEVAGQECAIKIVKDITERKFLENQLHQSQKMEAVGRLSAGVAHDFNNLLGVIIGYSEDLEEHLEETNPMRKKAEQIKKAGERAAALTRQLLAFSRQQVLEPKVLNLNSVIADLRAMLPRLLGPDIDVQTCLDPGLARVKADRGQIEQVIVNLAVNARDAMLQGGRLAIETRNVLIGAQLPAGHPAMTPGHYALIAVSDTGVGMDTNTQDHIFEPFFTTKERGKGTGLGLATVYGVVKQSGGYVWVESAPGLGTTFTIYLPRVGELLQPEPGEARMATLNRGSETILLVEDQDELRTLASALLERGGYTVLEANGGSQAMEIAQKHRSRIHLLLTDMVMPGMNGREVAKRVLEIDPGIRVLYTSGYAEFTHDGSLDPADNFLPKPFTRDGLLRKVDEVLHSQAVGSQRLGDRLS